MNEYQENVLLKDLDPRKVYIVWFLSTDIIICKKKYLLQDNLKTIAKICNIWMCHFIFYFKKHSLRNHIQLSGFSVSWHAMYSSFEVR